MSGPKPGSLGKSCAGHARLAGNARRIYLVHLLCFVHLVSLIQLNKRDKPNQPERPHNGLLVLASFFSVLPLISVAKGGERRSYGPVRAGRFEPLRHVVEGRNRFVDCGSLTPLLLGFVE